MNRSREMASTFRRFLVLALTLVVLFVPAAALAQEGEDALSGEWVNEEAGDQDPGAPPPFAPAPPADDGAPPKNLPPENGGSIADKPAANGTPAPDNGGAANGDLGSLIQQLISAILQLFGIPADGGMANPGITDNSGGTMTDNSGGTTTPNDKGATPEGGEGGADPTGTPVSDSTAAQIKERYGITLLNGTAANVDEELRLSAGQWSAQEMLWASQLFSVLPAPFYSCTTKVAVNQSLGGDIAGVFSPETGIINISQEMSDEQSFKGTLIHEMTHAFQNAHRDIEAAWKAQFWNGNSPKSSSVSDYGNSADYEDMAESVRIYYLEGARMKAEFPDRYAFVKDRIFGGKEF